MIAKLNNTEAALRELLILAAKAADIEITTWSNCQAGGFRKGGIGLFWNPANDDGDSRRLEVALRLEINQYELGVEAEKPGICSHYEPFDGTDPEVATRLAVLYVAAEIGRKMG